MEMYDGGRHFYHVKSVTTPRCNPYVFRTARDNAVVFGIFSSKGDTLRLTSVDQLKGSSFNPTLFKMWQPLIILEVHQNTDYEVGNATKDDYAYLFPMTDSTRQAAIGLCRNGEFSLLPTASPIPMKGPEGQEILYRSLITDKPRQVAYLYGEDRRTEAEGWAGKHIIRRHYLLRIDYAQALQAKGKATLTLYYTDKLDVVSFDNPTVTDHGDVVLTGGKYRDNYTPLASVYIFRLGDNPAEPAQALSRWLWVVLGFFLVTAVTVACWLMLHRRQSTGVPADTEVETDANQQNTVIMERVSQLLEKQKLYLNSDLKLQDIAAELGIHPNAVSAAINSEGCSFNQFVNDYRVDYAKQLLREKPDQKISTVYYEAGFGHETTFFRAFKIRTGMTPTEWKKLFTIDNT